MQLSPLHSATKMFVRQQSEFWQKIYQSDHWKSVVSPQFNDSLLASRMSRKGNASVAVSNVLTPQDWEDLCKRQVGEGYQTCLYIFFILLYLE